MPERMSEAIVAWAGSGVGVGGRCRIVRGVDEIGRVWL